MKETSVGFKRKFFLFLAISFIAVFSTSFVVTSYVVSTAAKEFKKAELSSLLSLYSNQFEHKTSSILNSLKDISSKSVVISPLMEFNKKDIALRDYLEDQKVLGLEGKFTILSFDGKPLYGAHQIRADDLELLINGSIGQIVRFKPDQANNFIFELPILFNGEAEGVLTFTANIPMKNLVGDFDRKYQIIIRKDGSAAEIGEPVLGSPDKTSRGMDYGFVIELVYDQSYYFWPAFFKILYACISLFVIGFGLWVVFYRKGKEQFVNPHEELIRTRKELNNASNLNHLVLNSLDELVVSTDRFGNIMSFNREAELSLGYRKEEVVGLHTPLLWHERADFLTQGQENLKQSQEFEMSQLISKALDTSVTKPKTWAIQSRSGKKFPARLKITAIEQGASVLGYVFLINDITDELLGQAKQRKATQEIEKATRLKSEFLANMSHEIRTPMNGILGMVSMLVETPLNSEQRDMLKVVKSSGDGLMTILNDILDLSKIESGKIDLEMVNFSVFECLEEAILLSNFRAKEKSITLDYKIADSTPEYLFGDVTRIRQVIVNLLSNAVKFTSEGSVRVDVQAAYLGDDKHNISISVIDSGIGISEEDQKKLFSAFSQADASITRRFGGTGLGLTIISKLASLMGGSISLNSKSGQGSTFTFALELKEGEFPKPKLEKSQELLVPGVDAPFTHRLLAVEDNAINQKIVVMMLGRLGYTCDVAANGIEALKALEDKKNLSQDPYTLIFMDMQMPEMDGITATQEILKKYGNERPLICAMTANAFKEDRDRCMEAGMDGFIAKPIQLEELSQVLELYGASLDLPRQKTSALLAEVKKPELSVDAESPKDFGDDTDDGGLDSFDREALLESFLGDESILFELVEDFGEQWPTTMEEIRQAVTGRDTKSLEILAHTLKGLTGTFRADESKSLCIKLEARAKVSNFEDIETLVMQLEEELELLQESLQKMAG